MKLVPVEYPQLAVLNHCIMPNHVHLLVSVASDETQDMNRSKMLVSKVMQSFKASVTRASSLEMRPVWQSRFYDHVVRNDADLFRIWEYIESNPAKWAEDRYYSEYI